MKRHKKNYIFFAALLCILMIDKNVVQAEEYWPMGPDTQGESAVVMEASTGTVLYEKNPHEQLRPASITKIMTTLVALEHCSLDEEVTFSHDAVFNIERDSTHISRDVGEIMTMEQCLYAVILASANDCAYAVAEHAGNGYENFINMMNEKLEELGCADSHFCNPHGLDEDEHYTSAYDMALISREALKNETFRTIVSTKRYTIPTTNKHKNDETPLVNQHKMLTNYQGETKYLYEGCIGGKNGFTDLARNTLVTFAERDDMTLICVVMKERNNMVQYDDTRQLLDFCFENFRLWNVSENVPENLLDIEDTGTAKPADTEIFGTTGSFADLDNTSCIVLPQSAAFSDASYEWKENINSDVAVSIEYSYAGRVVGSASIRATNAKVEQYPFHDTSEKFVTDQEEQIDWIRYVVIGFAVAAALALIGFLLYYVCSNFFILRHKHQLKSRQKKRFKEIKQGRHTKWKTRW